MSRLKRQCTARGELVLPAVPDMVDAYVKLCDETFTALGVCFSGDELEALRANLKTEMDRAFAESSRSDIVVSYECPVGLTVNYHVVGRWHSVAAAYDNWVATREPPLFGTEPDARAWELAHRVDDPAALRVLDIGAGTGRNSLALARRGHPVDAVEMTARFADIIRTEAAAESLNVRVIERDVFSSFDDLGRDYGMILLSEVVSDFRDVAQVRGVFELAAQCLAPGGSLLFNAFLVRDGHQIDSGTRQFGEHSYTSIFTYEELAEAVTSLPLELSFDDSVYEYERAGLAEEYWPPTSWYATWVRGLDVFDVDPADCPIEMRWLEYRKIG